MKKQIVLAEEEEPPGLVAQTRQSNACSGPVAPHLVSLTRNLAHPVPRLTISPRSHAFRKQFFPEASVRDWNDWRWQNRNRIRDLRELERIIEPSADEREAIERHTGPLPLGITPYYASLLDAIDPTQPLRKTVVPVDRRVPEEARRGGRSAGRGPRQPGAGSGAPLPGPGAVPGHGHLLDLLPLLHALAAGRRDRRAEPSGAVDLEAALDYIAAHARRSATCCSRAAIRSALDDDGLEYLLTRLRRSRTSSSSASAPRCRSCCRSASRPRWCACSAATHPLWMSIHFTHPDELTPEDRRGLRPAGRRRHPARQPDRAAQRRQRRRRDHEERSCRACCSIRVRPYYLYQCDPITGLGPLPHARRDGARDHPRTCAATPPGMRCRTFVIDAPGGGGKIPLLPDYVVGRDGDDLLLRNYEDRTVPLPRPAGRAVPGTREATREDRPHVRPAATTTWPRASARKRRPSSTGAETIDGHRRARLRSSATRRSGSASCPR